MRYRADVDGLRAVAIVPVVLFHAGIDAFSGGFVGVDVFFVVSGYLITSLIVADVRAGRFSIAHFYERRARRILPALFTMMFVSAAVAPLVMPTGDLEWFGDSIAAVALFGSNILFARQSGYFERAAETNPLLHAWSLAVEEQFYIVYPLLLLALMRRAGDRFGLALVLLAIFSFVASVLETIAGSIAAFYLAPYRAWELLAGAVVALGMVPSIASRPGREVAALTGLALIAIAVFSFSPHTPFPGLAALLPCVGTLLILHAGDSGLVTLNRVLGRPLLVRTGLISYSLYLWHWPLFVFTERYLQRPLGGAEAVGAITLSLLLAVLSWRFVERPFRRHTPAGVRTRRVLGAAAAATLLGVALGLFGPDLWMASGVRPVAFAAPAIRAREDYRDGNCFLGERQTYDDWAKREPCTIGDAKRPTVLIWGDSFAAHYVPGLLRMTGDSPWHFVQYSGYSCPPVRGVRVPWAPNCHGLNERIEDVMRRHPPMAVMLVARWERYWGRSVYAPKLQETLRFLKDRGLYVVLVGQGPSFEFESPPEYVFRTGRTTARSKDAEAINHDLRRLNGYDVFFDPTTVLCEGGECVVKEGDEFLFWDSGHLSSYGSARLTSHFLQTLSGQK